MAGTGWRFFLSLQALVGAAAPLEAQVVRVRVAEADGGKPVLGALVSLERDGKARVGQALSDPGGRAILKGTGTASYRVRADRIGYEGVFSVPFNLAADDTTSLTLMMPGTRVMLPEITVNSRPVCNLDRESGTALAALWAEAKKALVGTSLTARIQPPELEVTNFEREFDRRDRVIREQSVTHRRRVAKPFVTVDPEHLIERGFVEERDNERWYSAPDAELLLSDPFLMVHCFRVVRAPKNDSTLVGLAFEPTKGRKVPEVKGTLWLDRETSELRRLDYQYTNLDRRLSAGQEGGRLEFQRLPSGGWIVNDWVIRMPVIVRLRSRSFSGTAEERDSLIGIRENGGRAVLLTAGGPVPTRALLTGIVFDSVAGVPLMGALVSMAGGAYRDTTDAAGRYRIETPTRGNFVIAVDHPRLRLLGGGPLEGSALLDRGQVTTVDLALPPLARLEPRLCRTETADPTKSAILAGFLRDGSGAPIPFGRLRMRWIREITITESVAGIAVSQRGTDALVAADAQGVFRACGVPRNSRIWLEAGGGFAPTETSLRVEDERLAVRDLTLVPAADLAGRSVVQVQVEGGKNGPVAGAALALAPANDSVRADVDGLAIFTGVREGSHLLEVKALGFEGQRQEVIVGAADTARVTVLLAPSALVLAPLEVAAAAPRRVHPMMAGFEERRKEGMGHFFTLDHLKTRETSPVSNVLRMSPGMRLVPLPSPCNGYAAATGRSQSGVPLYCQGVPLLAACYLAVFVDGMNFWNARLSEPPPDLDQFRVNDLEAIEVYVGPSQLPAQYSMSGADCGAVLLWHRVSSPD